MGVLGLGEFIMNQVDPKILMNEVTVIESSPYHVIVKHSKNLSFTYRRQASLRVGLEHLSRIIGLKSHKSF